MYVNCDHAGEKRTHHLRMGFFIFMNTALVQWFSKQQAEKETSVFGAEFVAMKIGFEVFEGTTLQVMHDGSQDIRPLIHLWQ